MYGYQQQLHYFEYKFNDEKLIKEFEEFIQNNLSQVFSQAYDKSERISVPYNLAKSVINEGGAYNRRLTSLVNTLQMRSPHPNYKDGHQQSIFAVIVHESKTMQGLMSKLDKYQQELSENSYQWNKVFYGNYLERTYTIS